MVGRERKRTGVASMKDNKPFLSVLPTPKKMMREKALKKFAEQDGNTVPTFTEVKNDFVHSLEDVLVSFPAVDVKVTNATRTGKAAVLVTGGLGQHNALFVIEDGKAKDVAKDYGLEGPTNQAAYGIAIGDINNDGEDEILIGMENGIYVYSRDAGTDRYTQTELDIELPEADRAIPLSIALGDTRKSGNLDMYVSTFIKPKFMTPVIYNDPTTSTDNAFYVNNGDGTFTEATTEAGLTLHQNCFEASLTDFTGDGYPDIVVALNTDRPRMWGNNGDGTFTEKDLPGEYGFWMGLAVGDTNGSGLPDFFLANSGKSVPQHFARGDLRDDQVSDLESRHFRNLGNYEFTDVTEETGTVTEAFAWGSVFADFTNNGHLDLVVTENYVQFPMKLHEVLPTAGKLFLQGVNGKFVRAEQDAGVANYHFGYKPLAVDLTGSGYNDLVIGNLRGPLRIFLNDLG